MSKIYLIITLIILGFEGFSQSSEIVWQKALGGSGFDDPSSVAYYPDGGFIIAGTSDSNSGFEKNEDSFGETDFWIVRINRNGDILWSKTYGGVGYEFNPQVSILNDGNIVIAGESDSPISGNKEVDSNGDSDIWVLKLNSQGNKIWEKSIGGSSYEYVTSVETYGVQNYILISYKSYDSNFLKNKYLLIYNEEVIWDRQILDGCYNLDTKVLFPDDGSGFILATSSPCFYAQGDKSENSKGNIDYWIIKYDFAGNRIWDNVIGGSGNDVLTDVINTVDGGFLVAGESYSNISSDKGEDSRGSSDYWLIKLNSQGELVWEKTLGGNLEERNPSAIETFDGYIISGFSNSNAGSDKSSNSQGGYDIWLLKINKQGNLLWDKTIGGSGDEYNYYRGLITAGLDRHFLLVYGSESGNSGSKESALRGSEDFWILRMKDISNEELRNPKTVAGANGYGSSLSQFQPIDVFVNRYGEIVVADIINSRVIKFSENTENGVVIAGGNGRGNELNKTARPTGICYDKFGNLYVSDRENHRVLKFTPNSSSGLIVAGGNGQGSNSNQLNSPYGILVDEQNNLFVLDRNNHRIQKWIPGSSNGSTVLGGNGNGSNSNQLSYPDDICIDSDGDLYVADGGNSRIVKLNFSTNTSSIVIENIDVTSLVIDKDNNIIYSTGNGFIKKYSQKTTTITSLVGRDTFYNYKLSRDNEFQWPRGLFYKDDFLYICDYDNYRIQKYNLGYLNLYNSIKFAGGLTSLEHGKAYSYNFEVKNTGTANLAGEVYMKIGSGGYELVAASQAFNAGSTTGLNGMFTPLASQTRNHQPIELFFKEAGSSTYQSLGTLNGTLNPTYIDIIAPLQEPVVREAFISLNKFEVNPGETVTITGGNFNPGSQVYFNSYPELTGLAYPTAIVNTDGSLKVNISIPQNTTDESITFIASDGNGNSPGSLLLINQPQNVANLEILKPSIAYETLTISPKGTVLLEIQDKLIDDGKHPITGSSRAYKFEIGFRFSGETVEYMLYTSEQESQFINDILRKSYSVKMDYFQFDNPTSQGGYPIQFYVKDLFDPSRKTFSPVINLEIVNTTSQITLLWDKSLPFDPVTEPKGIAADGTSRIYFMVEKITSAGSPISNVALLLTSYESNQDENLNNPTWLGKVKYATVQNNLYYDEEANSANSIGALSSSVNSDGKYLFWYLAPDDFNVPSIPNLYSLNEESERTVFAKFTIIYADNSTEYITRKIKIIRPPLMLVHGLSGDEHSWDKFKLKDEPLWKLPPKAVRMLPDASFFDNAQGLVDNTLSVSYESSFQSILTKYRSEGWVANRVDYICHSMGGSMLRTLEQSYPEQYYVGKESNLNIKNYGKGFVNKFITINTPHNGSPIADLFTFSMPHLPKYIKEVLTFNYDEAPALGLNSNSFIKNFLRPDFKNSIQGNGYYEFTTTNAVRNLMTNQYGISADGIRFKETNLKSHLIGSDIFQGNLLPTDKLMQQLLVAEASIRAGILLSSINSVGSQYKSILKLGKKNAYKLIDYYNSLRLISKSYGISSNLWTTYEAHNIDKIAQIDGRKFNVGNNILNLFGEWNQKYPDFIYNGDLVVPTQSQIANIYDSSLDNVTVITNLEVESIEKIGNNIRLNHLNITDIPETHQVIKRLLNSSINSFLFNKIPANNNPTPHIYEPPSGSTTQINNDNSLSINEKGNPNKIVSSNPTVSFQLIEHYNREKVTISSPLTNSSFQSSEKIIVKVNVTDTVGLVSCKLVLGGNLKEINEKANQYSFLMNPSLTPNLRTRILAAATYEYPDSVVIVYDSLFINVISTEPALKLIAKPKNYEIGVGQELTPSLTVIRNSYTSSPLFEEDLTVSIENNESLFWDNQLKALIGKKRGESKVVFGYQGLQDSVYVKIDKGGITPNNTLHTGLLNNNTVCQGGLISVPYSYIGAFEANNSFLVQIAPENSNRFQTLESFGSGNPQLARIPNNLIEGAGYKIRTVSTNIPMLGENSLSTLTVTKFADPPLVRSNKSQFNLGESITLTASGCSNTVKWSDGQTGNQINISPTESTVYRATCTNYACESADSEPIIINKYLCEPNVSRTSNISGAFTQEAGLKIESSEKVQGSGSRINYEAPITVLKPGFETDDGVIFQVLIGGCNE